METCKTCKNALACAIFLDDNAPLTKEKISYCCRVMGGYNKK